jgi:hypothetical protein
LFFTLADGMNSIPSLLTERKADAKDSQLSQLALLHR